LDGSKKGSDEDLEMLGGGKRKSGRGKRNAGKERERKREHVPTSRSLSHEGDAGALSLEENRPKTKERTPKKMWKDRGEKKRRENAGAM